MIHFRRVKGNSMLPTLRDGQIIVVSSHRSYKVGDVVIAFMDGKEVVKRISKRRDGKVYLLGDNEKESSDSRKHGWLVDRHVVGEVVFPFGLRRR